MPDLADVIGQRDAVEALIAAAAGGHHMLMSGPPGAGKTMLASRLPGHPPRARRRRGARGRGDPIPLGRPGGALARRPPLEAPHHSASIAALVGGGSRVLRPGAIARATHGVLFLDEVGEFPPSVLDALRQPLEKGAITIHRAGVAASFPASFQLILATNPCPCGNYGVRGASCICPPMAIRRYLGKLSGPLLDRVDIELGLARVSVAHAADLTVDAVTTDAAAARVAEARARAAHRLRDTPWRINARVSGPWLREGPLALAPVVRRPIDAALQRGSLTLRGYDRVLRVAWTLGDLAGRASPSVARHRSRALHEERHHHDDSAPPARSPSRARSARATESWTTTVPGGCTPSHIWSCLIEPGDGVAGRIVVALGPEAALDPVVRADSDPGVRMPPGSLPGSGRRAWTVASTAEAECRPGRARGRPARAGSRDHTRGRAVARRLSRPGRSRAAPALGPGRCRHAGAPLAVDRPRRVPARRPATASTSRWKWPPSSSAAASPSCRGPPTASTGRPTELLSRRAASPSLCSRAAWTGRIRPGTRT